MRARLLLFTAGALVHAQTPFTMLSADALDGVSEIEDNFGAEDKLMMETEFPPRQCHMDEHAAVLASVREVRERLAQGRVDIARDLLAHLTEWFPKHTQHLDSALAHWANKSRLGGKAVVIKRGLSLR